MHQSQPWHSARLAQRVLREILHQQDPARGHLTRDREDRDLLEDGTLRQTMPSGEAIEEALPC